jgi:hypothetical protein
MGDFRRAARHRHEIRCTVFLLSKPVPAVLELSALATKYPPNSTKTPSAETNELCPDFQCTVAKFSGDCNSGSGGNIGRVPSSRSKSFLPLMTGQNLKAKSQGKVQRQTGQQTKE